MQEKVDKAETKECFNPNGFRETAKGRLVISIVYVFKGHSLRAEKNDRPRDDGTLRRV